MRKGLEIDELEAARASCEPEGDGDSDDEVTEVAHLPPGAAGHGRRRGGSANARGSASAISSVTTGGSGGGGSSSSGSAGVAAARAVAALGHLRSRGRRLLRHQSAGVQGGRARGKRSYALCAAQCATQACTARPTRRRRMWMRAAATERSA